MILESFSAVVPYLCRYRFFSRPIFAPFPSVNIISSCSSYLCNKIYVAVGKADATYSLKRSHKLTDNMLGSRSRLGLKLQLSAAPANQCADLSMLQQNISQHSPSNDKSMNVSRSRSGSRKVLQRNEWSYQVTSHMTLVNDKSRAS